MDSNEWATEPRAHRRNSHLALAASSWTCFAASFFAVVSR